MPNPLPRKRFQIHLSTAVVMMFVAGGLIWINVRMNIGNPDYQVSVLVRFDTDGSVIDYHGYSMGYPFIFQEPMFANEASSEAMTKETPGVPIGIIGMRSAPLIADLVIGLIVLLATWFVCEWTIRRSEQRKGGVSSD